MTVTRDDLERQLEKLISKVKDPRAGLFGPTSHLWRINRETSNFMGGGRAALLQTAHPFVAHGVDQHSKTKTDPQGRFRRTFHHIFAMVFGDLNHAVKSARNVHTLHQTITGKIRERVGAFAKDSPYEANNEDALLWVHATLWDTSITCYELIFGELDLEVKNQYYEETKLFAYLFGIPDSVLPPDWPSFTEYNRKMWDSDVLTVGKPALELSRFLLSSPSQSLEPVMGLYKILTAGLLPKRIRSQYRLPFGRFEQTVFNSMIATFRAGIPLLPPRVKYLPAYIDAQRRLQGAKSPDRIGQMFERLVTTSLKGNRARAAA